MTTKHDVSKFINFKFSAKFKFENHIVYWFMLLFTFFLLYVVSEPIVQNITLVEFPLFLHAKHYPNTLHHPSPHLDVGTLTHKHTNIWFIFCFFFYVKYVITLSWQQLIALLRVAHMYSL